MVGLTLIIILSLSQVGTSKFSHGPEAEKLCQAYQKVCPRGKICAIQSLHWPRTMKFPVCIHEKTIPVLSRVCTEAPSPGSCAAQFRRWYYNVHMAACSWFTYGGCGGNDNNFRSREECEQVCIPSSATDHTSISSTDDYDVRRKNDEDDDNDRYIGSQVSTDNKGNERGYYDITGSHGNVADGMGIHSNRHNAKIDSLTEDGTDMGDNFRNGNPRLSKDQIPGYHDNYGDENADSSISITDSETERSNLKVRNSGVRKITNEEDVSEHGWAYSASETKPLSLTDLSIKVRPHQRDDSPYYESVASPESSIHIRRHQTWSAPSRTQGNSEKIGYPTSLRHHRQDTRSQTNPQTDHPPVLPAHQPPRMIMITNRITDKTGSLASKLPAPNTHSRVPYILQAPVRAIDITSGITQAAESSYAAGANEITQRVPNRGSKKHRRKQNNKRKGRKRKNRRGGKRNKTQQPGTPLIYDTFDNNSTFVVVEQDNKTSAEDFVTNLDLANDQTGRYAELRESKTVYWPENTQNEEESGKENTLNLPSRELPLSRENPRRQHRKKTTKKNSRKSRKRGGVTVETLTTPIRIDPSQDSRYYHHINLFGLLEKANSTVANDE